MRGPCSDTGRDTEMREGEVISLSVRLNGMEDKDISTMMMNKGHG